LYSFRKSKEDSDEKHAAGDAAGTTTEDERAQRAVRLARREVNMAKE
jgi:hypothetical protein